MNPSPTFIDVYSVCYKAFQTSPDVKHVSQVKINQTALDVTIIAVGVRSGYLVDSFSLRNPRKSLKDFFVELLAILRQEFDVFKSVTVLHDEGSDQVFIVNVPKLRTYYDSTREAFSPALLVWVTFIELDGSRTKVSPPPLGLLTMFKDALPRFPCDTEPPLLLHLPEDHMRTLGDMVAIAACLLEFPVAYVPTSDGSEPFLAGVPLDVYECALVYNSLPRPEHVMLKFSCPQSMAVDAPELRPEALVERLRARFTDRLEQAGFPGTLVVRCHAEMKDRVAL